MNTRIHIHLSDEQLDQLLAGYGKGTSKEALLQTLSVEEREEAETLLMACRALGKGKTSFDPDEEAAERVWTRVARMISARPDATQQAFGKTDRIHISWWERMRGTVGTSRRWIPVAMAASVVAVAMGSVWLLRQNPMEVARMGSPALDGEMATNVTEHREGTDTGDPDQWVATLVFEGDNERALLSEEDAELDISGEDEVVLSDFGGLYDETLL